jgi:hypothetical protein
MRWTPTRLAPTTAAALPYQDDLQTRAMPSRAQVAFRLRRLARVQRSTIRPFVSACSAPSSGPQAIEGDDCEGGQGCEGARPRMSPSTAVLGQAGRDRRRNDRERRRVPRDEHGMMGKPAVPIGRSLDRKNPGGEAPLPWRRCVDRFPLRALSVVGIRRCYVRAINGNDDDLTVYPVVPKWPSYPTDWNRNHPAGRGRSGQQRACWRIDPHPPLARAEKRFRTCPAR